MAHIRRLLAVGVAKMTVNEARIAYVGQQLELHLTQNLLASAEHRRTEACALYSGESTGVRLVPTTPLVHTATLKAKGHHFEQLFQIYSHG